MSRKGYRPLASLVVIAAYDWAAYDWAAYDWIVGGFLSLRIRIPSPPYFTMNRFSFAVLICTGTLLLSQMGCGSADPQEQHVSGAVTFNGAPVLMGDIQFLPKSGNPGPAGSAKVIDGKFDTAVEGGRGTVGGPHAVIINGFDGQAEPEAELPLGKPLFSDYKVDFDIPSASGPTTKNFDITLK
ncbi:MAG: hypothetical protein ACF788_03155 [Novipirellula sp. JB048]